MASDWLIPTSLANHTVHLNQSRRWNRWLTLRAQTTNYACGLG